MVECRICSEKNQKFQLFLSKSGRKAFWQKLSLHASRFNDCSSFFSKTELFEAYREYSINHFFQWRKNNCTMKNPETEFLSLITHQKNNWQPKTLIRSLWNCRSFYAESKWIRPIGVAKISFEELKRSGMSRTKKKRNQFYMSSANKTT